MSPERVAELSGVPSNAKVPPVLYREKYREKITSNSNFFRLLLLVFVIVAKIVIVKVVVVVGTSYVKDAVPTGDKSQVTTFAVVVVEEEVEVDSPNFVFNVAIWSAVRLLMKLLNSASVT